MDINHGSERIKVFNIIFTDAQYSFSMLKFYYEHMTALLRRSNSDFQAHTGQLEIEYKKRQQKFDKQYWDKHYNVYREIYPGFFNNSFAISACSLFEHQIKKLCDLIKEEHKLPVAWDDMERAPVPTKAKRFLSFAGVILKDDPPGSFQHWISTSIPGKNNLTIKELWQELENYFMVRNCLAHHNGMIQKLRKPDKVRGYAIEKGILIDKAGQLELRLTDGFNKGMCDTMEKFFDKLTSAYYSTQLPE